MPRATSQSALGKLLYRFPLKWFRRALSEKGEIDINTIHHHAIKVKDYEKATNQGIYELELLTC